MAMAVPHLRGEYAKAKIAVNTAQYGRTTSKLLGLLRLVVISLHAGASVVAVPCQPFQLSQRV